MTTNAHPQVTAALQQFEQFHEALNEQIQQVDNGTFTGTDEAETVEVTVDGGRWLTGVYINDGLLRLGAQTVAERLNEALRNAQAAASESMHAQHAALFANLNDLTTNLKATMGLT